MGVPLKDWGVNIYRGILTGYNEAFIISGAKKDELIAADPKSAEIIRPILRGRDIKRYGYNFADQWLIATFPSRHYDIERYPAVKKHLLSFGMERLEQTGKTYYPGTEHEFKARKKTHNKWFETQDSISYWEDFSKQKLIWAELARTGNAFTVDDGSKSIVLNTCYILTTNNIDIDLRYLLAVLNSKIILFYMNITSSKFDENGWRWLKQFVDILPIVSTENKKQHIINIVNDILSAKERKQNTIDDENNIDSIISSIYGLNDEEEKYVREYIFISQ